MTCIGVLLQFDSGHRGQVRRAAELESRFVIAQPRGSSVEAVHRPNPQRVALTESLNRTGSIGVLRKMFAPIISREEKALALRCLFEMVSLLEAASVSYFLYGGSLIGSWRHHGMIPWDDDIDVMVNKSHRALLTAVLANRSLYGLDSGYEHTYKWYSHEGAAAGGRKFKWPYVDIFFFEENATHIWDSEVYYSSDYVYRKDDVFPLVRRPFEGLRLPAPRNSGSVIAVTYNVSLCQTSGYLHKQELSVPVERRITTECKNLHSLYPFAFCSTPLDGGGCLVEGLKVGDRIVARKQLR